MSAGLAGVGRALALCAVLLAGMPLGAAASALDGFAGFWVRAERERDDAARDAMIVRATEPMSFAIRGFARRVMRKRMVPVERYLVEQREGAPLIRDDNGWEFPLDGRPHVAGENRQFTSRLTERGEIEQSWQEGPDRHGTTVWRLDGDGRLVVSQRAYDSHFAEPLEYSTTYRRQRGGSAR